MYQSNRYTGQQPMNPNNHHNKPHQMPVGQSNHHAPMHQQSNGGHTGSEAPNPNQADSGWKDRIELASYGNSAAIQFSESQTAARNGKNEGWNTLMLEGAVSTGKARSYNWNTKISFQILQNELPEFIAVMLGMKTGLKFESHGAEKNKGLEIQVQDKAIFVKLYQGNNGVRAVPVQFHDALMIGHLALTQYCLNYRGVLTSDTALEGIRMLYGNRG